MSNSKRTNYNALRKIANKVLTQDDLASQIIIQKGSKYHAFNEYTIEETQFGWQVTAEMADGTVLFNTAKVALAWCIAQKTKNFALCSTMEDLDHRVTKKQFDIDMITHMLDNRAENRAVLMARLMEDINNRRSYKKQLAKCVETAKYMKLKGTNNELDRFNKTSRRKRGR